MENIQEYLEPSQLIQKLQRRENNTLILRKLIHCASARDNSLKETNLQWDLVLAELFKTITLSTQIGNERVLLTSHAFFALLSTECSSVHLKNIARQSLELSSLDETNEIYFMNEKYVILDIELFRLIIAHGFLQLHRHNNDCRTIYILIFDVLYKHCIQYSRYSYCAYKILHMWLNRTISINFWASNDVSLEKKLESIIFSNWCNAISDISKNNATAIFNMYLKIMERKYHGFLGFLFGRCVNDLSWQSEIKYIILTEICNVWDDIEAMTSSNLLTSLCTSLTMNYLRHAGTNTYMSILRKLDEDKWKDSFGLVLKSVLCQWESRREYHDAIRLLCKFWLEPTAKKYKGILPYLWQQCENLEGHLFQSHLQRIASEMQVDMPERVDPIFYMNHEEEDVRLNGFAISSHRLQRLMQLNEDNPFFAIKQFLWYNANTTSMYLREGIIKYFEVFYINLLKTNVLNDTCEQCVQSMMSWLHEFILDCFEIGSCYQRKILGLRLYQLILSFVEGSTQNNYLKGSRRKKLLSNGHQKFLTAATKYQFVDRKSLFLLLRLVLNTANDVKETAAGTIINHFHHNMLTDTEKKVLFEVAVIYCDSPKFYEIESGTILMKLLANWVTKSSLENVGLKINKLHSNYSEFLFEEAQGQLLQLKQDILKGIVQNTPFYGVLYGLLRVGFQRGPESHLMTISFAENLLDLIEDAVNFFLSVLSSKSTDSSTSSSFAEMGLAIDEAIRTSDVDDKGYDELNLSPAHRVIISCIWMSLKVCCDMSSEIGMSMYSPESVRRALNLIATVSLKCRHKGAVEAAGTAIGALTRCLHNKEEYAELPRAYVEKLLQKDKKNTLNVTRRGAGLSIMFHRIVVSDNRRERPLVHFAVKALLQSLEEEESFTEATDCQHDSPCARHLHFLRALVADKEIHAQLAPYMEQISLLSFRYLQSEVWVIRNAGLQLFGAVVPRLVGQNTGKVLNFGNGYSIDHFVTHYPVLADHVKTKLYDFSRLCEYSSVPLHTYSSVVHILILLSKMSCSGCDLTDFSSKIFIEELKGRLPALLGSPVAQVRVLVAKVYAAATSLSSIHDEMNKLLTVIPTIRSANMLHGYLLTVYYLKQKLNVEMESTNNVSSKTTEIWHKKYAKLYREDSMAVEETYPNCYILKIMFLQLMDPERVSLENYIVQKTFNWSLERMNPGFPEFIDLVIQNMAKFVNSNSLIDENIVNKILNSHNAELIISFLSHMTYCLPLLQTIMNQLLIEIHNYHELVLNAMISFVIGCLKLSPPNQEVEKISTELIVEIEKRESNTNLLQLKRVLLIQFSKDEEVVSEILLQVLDLCVHKEEELRQLACECIQFALCRLMDLNKENQAIIIQCCLILLKDEVFEIGDSIVANLRLRILAKMWENLRYNEVIYQTLLSQTFECCPENFNFLTKYTKDAKQLATVPTIENPFEHDDESLYREETKFLNIFFLSNQRAFNDLTLCNKDNERKKITDVTEAIYAKYELQKKIGFDFSNLRSVLGMKHMEYLAKKVSYVKELCHKH